MAGSKSDDLENKMLDHVLGGGDYTRPATVYISLYEVAPNDAGGGTEFTADGYARATVTNNATQWPAAAGGAKANGEEIAFAAATVDWGTANAFGVHDALSGGNVMYWADLTTPKTVSDGDTAKFAAGALDVTED